MIDAYTSGLDLYKDIMSFLLEKPYDQITSQERANGKVIILGCGFGMGWEQFIDYAATFGVTLDEATAKRYVNAFRDKYTEIPSFWKELNAACVKAVKLNICVYVRGLVVDGRTPQMLKIKLPSGRYLHYLRPIATEEVTDWGATREGVSYESWDEKGLNMKRLYGGLLCENVVQAVARDLLLAGMLEAEKAGFKIILTIHDEIVCESSLDSPLNLDVLLKCMTMIPEWAEGLGFILAAEGWDGPYYRK
jgi:DNA polymerase